MTVISKLFVFDLCKIYLPYCGKFIVPMENLTQQKDEIEALSSIYGTDWKEESDSGVYFSIEIDGNVKLYITLNPDYPSQSPPTYQLQAPSLNRNAKQQISNSFEEIYLENIGGPVIFQWIERLREFVNEFQVKEPTPVHSDNHFEMSKDTETNSERNDKTFDIIHGPAIQDRKSTFQGHFSEVKSHKDVESVKNILLQNKKISQATHNILAYRIQNPNGGVLQDCDDDGENHAGSRLLHLLQILNVTNVLVIVSRWYGGIQLGPDRFRHINNAARQVLGEAGVIKLASN